MNDHRIRTLSEQQQQAKQKWLDEGLPDIVAHAFALRQKQTLNEPLAPQLLTDMDKAVSALFPKLLQKLHICVVADYDADGATSCAIMVKGLSGMGQSPDNLHYFLPDRQIHGYGLQPSVVDDLLCRFPRTHLIITVDNGISAVAGVEYARYFGIQVIITDHHAEGDQRPQDALALINPNRKDCPFPSKALAGCGVACYLIEALKQKFQQEHEQPSRAYSEAEQAIIKEAVAFDTAPLLDYLTIGTVADLVPLDPNNQYWVAKGLERIRAGLACAGVKALMEVKEVDEDRLSTENIAFQLAPTLNAIGRLTDMSMGVALLLSDDYAQCLDLAHNAHDLNEERKDTEKTMIDLAQILMNAQTERAQFSCVVHLPQGHEGVIGIVASRIKEQSYLPTLVFVQTEEGELKGSGRSVEGLHIRDAVDYVSKKAPDCVLKFGGHAMACGLTIKVDKLPEFRHHFDEYCGNIFQHQAPNLLYQVDAELDLSTINTDIVHCLNQQIWGQAFPKPIYVGDFVVVSQRLLKNAHLKLTLEQQGQEYSAIWFRRNEFLEQESVKLLYSLSVNRWRGVESLQLMIVAQTR